jgi:5-(carboxyamino)imidazole ribonucleotide synthase
MAPEPLKPGATIGILGGGQLGRMLALAAARLGLRCHIHAPRGDNPAFDVAAGYSEAAYDDEAALDRLAGIADVVTYEFENVPAEAVARIARRTPVFPPVRALEASQDRACEKAFLRETGIATARWASEADVERIARRCAEHGYPGIIKTRRMGYDGKGQVRVANEAELRSAWHGFGGQTLIFEWVVPFTREVSVIAARGRDGSVRAYDVGENVHEAGILRSTAVPAGIEPATASAAAEIASRILGALDYVGVIGVELFVTEEEGREGLLVNEIAPRVHNSGHWTIDGCHVSQFEQHIRAIAGWPLGDPARHSDAVMENLLGAEIDGWERLARERRTAVHIYGKAQARPGRKMGHVTRLYPLGSLHGGGKQAVSVLDSAPAV